MYKKIIFQKYSLCYACLKMVNYSFLFWLPFYLSNKFGWSETTADTISIWYDVGGIFGKKNNNFNLILKIELFCSFSGGILVGFLSDLIKKRSIVIVVMLLIAIPSLYVFSRESVFVIKTNSIQVSN
jgi:OPA family glycerol-3-phosphate transporter-like MFS transporter 3